MKHIGETLKEYIEINRLPKGEIAEKVGITHNYLSTVFTKWTINADLLEKICLAIGLDPAVMFDTPGNLSRECTADGKNIITRGTPAFTSSERTALLDLIAEKERTIQLLMQSKGFNDSRQTETKS